jgi:hypothetical protein
MLNADLEWKFYLSELAQPRPLSTAHCKRSKELAFELRADILECQSASQPELGSDFRTK